MRRKPVFFDPRNLASGGLSFAVLTTLLALPMPAQADDWPQWMGPKRDAIWRETGILDKFPSGGPKVRWRTPIGGGYAGPAVVKDRVYVTDRILPEGVKNPANPFAAQPIPGKERILCLSDKSGEILWKHEYDRTYNISYPGGPRTTPIVHEGKVYTLGAMGDLFCLNADDGKVLWSKNFVKDYKAPLPMWGFAANPLLDGDKLICLVGGPDHIVVAFDKDTGKEKWHALSFEKADTQIGYCPPIVYEAGGKRQLLIWHPESLNSLDPETGKLYWSEPYKANANLTVSMPRQEGDLLLVTSFYNGAMMLKLAADKPAATVLWRSRRQGEQPNQTDTLNSIMPTPFLRDGYIYGVCSYGELRCLPRHRLQARLDDPQSHGRPRRKRALGQRLPDRPGRSLLPAQREGRSHHRPADPEGIRGDRPRPHPGADLAAIGSQGGLVAPGLRPQVDVRPQRQGNRLRLPCRGVNVSTRLATLRRSV